jgi:hypothetical protein
MRIHSGGNVSIGASNLGSKLHVYETSAADCNISFEATNGGYAVNMNLYGNNASGSRFNNIRSLFGANEQWYVGGLGSDSTLGFRTGGTERMRIDSSGRLLISTTATTPGYFNTSTGTQIQDGAIFTSSAGGSAFANPTSGGGVLMSFGTRNNWNTGTISTNNNNTAYNTSSDYRLKENIAPMTGALAIVSALKPCTYTWKSDASNGEGFIAHELQEVCPLAVTGEKDAVDADGNPKYQGVDTSFLVATLTAAIQEQQAIIESLTARIETLEKN